MKQPCLFLVGLGMAQHCPRAMAFLEEIHSTFPFLCPGNLLGQEFGSASVSHLQVFFFDGQHHQQVSTKDLLSVWVLDFNFVYVIYVYIYIYICNQLSLHMNCK